jgi:AAHS family 3-hydroxyphenylpropionic acid transporter
MTTHVGARTNVGLALLLCALAALCEGIDLQAAGVAAAGIRSEFHPDPQHLGYFFGASTFGLFIGALIGGRLADAIGRKGVLVASIAAFGVFTLLTPLAPTITTLTAARLLTGLGLGGALPNLIALVAESSSAGRRNVNVALVYSGTPLGGALISWFSMVNAPEHWRWIFVGGGIAPLILAPIMGLMLRESAAFTQARSAAHASRAAGAMPKSGSFLALLTEGRALRSLLLWVSFFLALLTLYLLLNWLPTLLNSHGLSKPAAAGAQIGFNLGGALAAALLGYLLEGRWRRASVLVNFVALPILLVVLANTPPEVWPTVIVVFLLGCAIVAAQAFMYAMAPAVYPTSIRGVGVGTAVGIGRIGSIVGPTLAGVLVGAGRTSSQVLLGILPLVIIGSLCAIALVWVMPKAQPKMSSIN